MASSLRDALAHHGIPFIEDDIIGMRGRGKRSALRRLVERSLGQGASPETVRSVADQTYETFKEMLRRHYREGRLEPIPGAEETMRWLRDRGVKVGATTAMDCEMRDAALSRLGWLDGLFDCTVASDEVPRSRPAPYMVFLAMMRAGVADVRRVAVVGDTPADLEAGRNAGVGWVVGVLSGVYGLETLGACPHTHLLESVAGLPRIFASEVS